MNTTTISPTIRILIGLNLMLAVCVLWFSGAPTKQFVLTPFYQVVPKGSVWTVEELSEIQAEMPSALEARDMHKAYARLGSTLSIDDVLRGIDALEHSQFPLTQAQHHSLQTAISELTSDHQEMQKTQRELIRLENQLVQQTKSWGVMP